MEIIVEEVEPEIVLYIVASLFHQWARKKLLEGEIHRDIFLYQKQKTDRKIGFF